MDIMNALETFLAVCGGISIIGGAITMIVKFFKPAIRLKERVDAIEASQEEGKKEIAEIKKLQAGTIQALVAIIDHEITGNHVDGLRKTKTDIMKLITEE